MQSSYVTLPYFSLHKKRPEHEAYRFAASRAEDKESV
jgi:hypothetical protein